MPTYEYLCQDCGQEFETFQSMKDDPLTDCTLCGSSGTVKRKIGRGAGIIFKGSGFYETDFKEKKGGKAGSEKASEGGKAGGSGAGDTSAPADANSGKKTTEKASNSTPAATKD